MSIITLSPSKTYTNNSTLIVNYNIPNTTEWQNKLQEAQNYDGVLYINLGTSTLTFVSEAITSLPATGSFIYKLGEATAISNADIYIEISYDSVMGSDTAVDYGTQVLITYDEEESELAQFASAQPCIYLNGQLTSGIFYQYINNVWTEVVSHVYVTPQVNYHVLGRATLGSIVLQ